jgi:hypothetical protein
VGLHQIAADDRTARVSGLPLLYELGGECPGDRCLVTRADLNCKQCNQAILLGGKDPSAPWGAVGLMGGGRQLALVSAVQAARESM